MFSVLPDIWLWYGGACIAALLLLQSGFYMRSRRKLKDANTALYRMKQEVRDIAQLPLTNPYPLIQVTAQGRIMFLNPAAVHAFPDLQDNPRNHPVLFKVQDLTDDARPGHREVVYNNLVYQQSVFLTQIGGQDSYIIYCYDITARKKYEHKLKCANEDAEKARVAAEKANQARGDFLANMSHELRTPMNGIIGLSDVLAEAEIKPAYRELAAAVNSSAKGLLILLNDILDFSKIEAGELTLEKIPFSIHDVVKQVVFLQKAVADNKGLSLKADIKDIVPAYMAGDPSRIQQILNNLISNALKFTKKGGVTIMVKGEMRGNKEFNLNLIVQDTGIGIPKEKQKAIFAKFQQADSATSREYGGTGLGLAITRDLAVLMGGDVALRSEPGKGTAFQITLPLQISKAPYRRGGEGDAEINGLMVAGAYRQDAKIMVVDDHPVNLLFMRQVLTKMGFEGFDEASSGKQALSLFESGMCYDLILMDCQMPEMDGFEAARRIRAVETLENEPVIIAVTADAMKGAEKKCLAAGMDDYISKPVDKEKLHILMAQWLPREIGEGEIEGAKMKETIDVKDTKRAILPEVFDWDVLYDFTQGDMDAQNQIIDIFIQSLDSDMAALEECYKAQNYEEWSVWVHKLFGACAHIGARALADICDVAQSVPVAELDKVQVYHKKIWAEYKRVYEALERKRAA